MTARSICLMMLLVAAPGAWADGDAYVPPDFMTGLPPLPASVDASTVWRLDLAEALRLAMRQNLNVVVERESVRISHLGIAVARGEFEPVLSATLDHGSANEPPITIQQGGAGQILTFGNSDWNLSLAQRLATGMQLSVGFTNNRTSSTAGTAVEPLNYLSTVSVSAMQPLLHGFSTDLALPQIDVLKAKIASEREREQLAVSAADVVERTEDAYWNVVQALYSYDLQLRSQKRAEEQMALTHRQIDAGLMPPSDLISAESTLAQRKLQLLQAEQAIDQTSDALRSILNLPREQWSRPILPIDLPRFVAETNSADEALAIAIKHRPELAQLDLDLKAEALAIRKAENDKLPEIDLGLTASLVGQDATYSGALGELGRADAPGYTVFLNMMWTPLRRATTAALEIERARQRTARARRDQGVQDIWFAVRDAVRNQHSAGLQVTAAAQFRELSTQSLAVEERKFLNGTSSNFVVAQRQEELAQAQLSELTAVLGYKKASAALLRATGMLLEARNVELEVRAKPSR